MFEFSGEYEPMINIIFLIVTAGVAWRSIRFRDADGNTDSVRLLFGCIAAVFFFMVLSQDVLGIASFG